MLDKPMTTDKKVLQEDPYYVVLASRNSRTVVIFEQLGGNEELAIPAESMQFARHKLHSTATSHAESTVTNIMVAQTDKIACNYLPLHKIYLFIFRHLSLQRKSVATAKILAHDIFLLFFYCRTVSKFCKMAEFPAYSKFRLSTHVMA